MMLARGRSAICCNFAFTQREHIASECISEQGQTMACFGEVQMSESLGIYLRDHLGGAQIAVQLLEAMCNRQEDERYREFAKRLLPDIQSDDNTLRSIIEAIAEEPSGIKNAGGWLLEKLTRLKLGHTRSVGLELFESLEMLSLGIAGKRSLWKALEVISKEDIRLAKFDFNTLLHRADEQYQAVEQERLRLARQVFVSEIGSK
jgi:hypothetical protein